MLMVLVFLFRLAPPTTLTICYQPCAVEAQSIIHKLQGGE